jgi:ABC-type lipoprotein export system ATPase subunit
MIGFFGL